MAQNQNNRKYKWVVAMEKYLVCPSCNEVEYTDSEKELIKKARIFRDVRLQLKSDHQCSLLHLKNTFQTDESRIEKNKKKCAIFNKKVQIEKIRLKQETEEFIGIDGVELLKNKSHRKQKEAHKKQKKANKKKKICYYFKGDLGFSKQIIHNFCRNHNINYRIWLNSSITHIITPVKGKRGFTETKSDYIPMTLDEFFMANNFDPNSFAFALVKEQPVLMKHFSTDIAFTYCIRRTYREVELDETGGYYANKTEYIYKTFHFVDDWLKQAHNLFAIDPNDWPKWAIYLLQAIQFVVFIDNANPNKEILATRGLEKPIHADYDAVIRVNCSTKINLAKPFSYTATTKTNPFKIFLQPKKSKPTMPEGFTQSTDAYFLADVQEYDIKTTQIFCVNGDFIVNDVIDYKLKKQQKAWALKSTERFHESCDQEKEARDLKFNQEEQQLIAEGIEYQRQVAEHNTYIQYSQTTSKPVELNKEELEWEKDVHDCISEDQTPRSQSSLKPSLSQVQSQYQHSIKIKKQQRLDQGKFQQPKPLKKSEVNKHIPGLPGQVKLQGSFKPITFKQTAQAQIPDSKAKKPNYGQTGQLKQYSWPVKSSNYDLKNASAVDRMGMHMFLPGFQAQRGAQDILHKSIEMHLNFDENPYTGYKTTQDGYDAQAWMDKLKERGKWLPMDQYKLKKKKEYREKMLEKEQVELNKPGLRNISQSLIDIMAEQKQKNKYR